MKKPIKLNLGCGLNTHPDYINIDNSPGVTLARFPRLKRLLFRLKIISEKQYRADWPAGITRLDLKRGLPFPDGSVERIYSSHFLEHLSADAGRGFLKECHRVLAPGGIFRLVVPDLVIAAEKYLEATRRISASPPGRFFRTAHDEFLKIICGQYLHKNRPGAEHCYIYDYPTLYLILSEIGFQKIERSSFRQSRDPDLASLDRKPAISLYLEIIR